VIGGRMKEEIDELTGEFSEKEWETAQKEEGAEYEALEFAYGCEGWEKPRRTRQATVFDLINRTEGGV
jgi:hypothetical protein